MISGIILFYIFAVDYLGFIFTASLIMLTLFFSFLKKYRLVAALGAIALSIGIYFLFSRVLLVPLPAGNVF
jgi:putative tricarboxylic transport membrane protein